MSGTQLPSIDQLKQQAKRSRAALARNGTTISHSQSLELLARQYGYADWNTLHAATGNRPAPLFTLSQQVSGQYLGQAYSGELISVRADQDHNWYSVVIRFDEPVDVVTFDSFSSFRRQVPAVVNRDGKSAEKTSNGVAQMVIKV